MRQNFCIKLWALLLIFVFGVLGVGRAGAQTEQTILTFTGANGSGPMTGLIEDSKGSFYGAAWNGGTNGDGVVYKLSRNAKGKWKQTILFDFGTPPDPSGSYPEMPSLAIDKHGHLYGTAPGGGEYGRGTVFELSPGKPYWKETVLYSFTGGADGNNPIGGVTLDSKGNVYGTTNTGGDLSLCGSGCGVVFELSPGKKKTWTYTVLHTFEEQSVACGMITDGANPYRTTLTFDSTGNIFGSTSAGGLGCGSWGTIWQLSPAGESWSYSQVYVLGTSGISGDAYPDAGGVFDSENNFYFATGGGNIFELVKAKGYQEQMIYQYPGPGADDVYGTVSFDGKGNLYWTSQSGFEGEGDKGGAYELSPNGEGGWSYKVLNAFSPDEGTQPIAGVLVDAAGNIYGTCSMGGLSEGDQGTVWEITP